MSTYSTATSPVNLTETKRALEEMQVQLAKVMLRLEDVGKKLFPRNDLCDGCDEFKADCLTVDEIDPMGQALTYCRACREEA